MKFPQYSHYGRPYAPQGLGAAPANAIDLATTAGVQQAYNDLLAVQADAQSIAPNVNLTGATTGLIGSAVNVSGNYGPETVQAVTDFQASFDVSPIDGKFGPITRAKMVEALSENVPGDTVTNGDSTVLLEGGRAIQPPAPPVPVPVPTPVPPVVVNPPVSTSGGISTGNAAAILLGVGVVGVLAYGAYRVMKDRRHHHRHLFA